MAFGRHYMNVATEADAGEQTKHRCANRGFCHYRFAIVLPLRFDAFIRDVMTPLAMAEIICKTLHHIDAIRRQQ